MYMCAYLVGIRQLKMVHVHVYADGMDLVSPPAWQVSQADGITKVNTGEESS